MKVNRVPPSKEFRLQNDHFQWGRLWFLKYSRNEFLLGLMITGCVELMSRMTQHSKICFKSSDKVSMNYLLKELQFFSWSDDSSCLVTPLLLTLYLPPIILHPKSHSAASGSPSFSTLKSLWIRKATWFILIIRVTSEYIWDVGTVF